MNDNPTRILGIDDEEGLTDAMEKLLRVRGFQTFSATDGLEAVGVFDKERPEMCIIDIQLGYSELDGLEVLERIKEIDSSAECLMITRITEEESIERAKKLGATHYLLKPIDVEDWIEVVMKVADKIKEGRQSG